MINITAINDSCYKTYLDTCLGTDQVVVKNTDVGNGLRYYHLQTNPNYGEGKVYQENCILMKLKWQFTNCHIKLISAPDTGTIPFIEKFLHQLWDEDESHTYFVFEDLPFYDCFDEFNVLVDYLKSVFEEEPVCNCEVTEDLF